MKIPLVGIPEQRDVSTDQREPTDGHLSRDDVFEILSNRRRRFALHHLLKRRSEEIYLSELVDHVASWEYGKKRNDLTDAERHRVRSALHQFHLPKMAEYGVVEYDPQRQIVTVSKGTEDLQLYLEVVREDDVSWGQYYLGLSLIEGFFLVSYALDFPPGTLLPLVFWAGFFVVSFGASALVHVYLNHTRMQLGSSGSPPEVQ